MDRIHDVIFVLFCSGGWQQCVDDITVARGRQHGYPTAATEPTAGAPDADRHGSSPAGPHQELSGKFVHLIDSGFLCYQNKK